MLEASRICVFYHCSKNKLEGVGEEKKKKRKKPFIWKILLALNGRVWVLLLHSTSPPSPVLQLTFGNRRWKMAGVEVAKSCGEGRGMLGISRKNVKQELEPLCLTPLQLLGQSTRCSALAIGFLDLVDPNQWENSCHLWQGLEERWLVAQTNGQSDPHLTIF